jgi:hypothetical protein
MEWANRLTVTGNEVELFCRGRHTDHSWFNLSPYVKITRHERQIVHSDLLIICSPHDIDLQKSRHAPKKVAIFMQMLEHLFRPDHLQWQRKCRDMYSSHLPLMSIAGWNMDYIRENFPTRGPMHYIGNGVNFEDFPIFQSDVREERTVLVEGWTCLNPSKDSDNIAHETCRYLKDRYGCKVITFSQIPPIENTDLIDEFYRLPDIKIINNLYARAKILIKASHYDARSCSPVEAMTKGTPTARAIDLGDDDLIDGENCLRTKYDLDSLINSCDSLLQDDELFGRISQNCIDYISLNGWDHWMPVINQKIQDIIGA